MISPGEPAANPEPPIPGTRHFGLFLRAGLFLLFIRFFGSVFASALHETIGYFPAAALSFFLAAVIASVFVVRTFERGRLEDIGMGWTRDSPRHLLAGAAAGILAALVVNLLPVVAGLAVLEPAPDWSYKPGRLLFVSVLLLFGAVGEEMMFRGYAFQILLRAYRPAAVIGAFAVLFALAHAENPSAGRLALFNTGLWGVLFGLAFHRTRDLWLPIGLHFGWNWVLPLVGVNLSGFEMTLTGYRLVWRTSDLWSGGAYGPEASILTSVAAALLGVWLYRARFNPQSAPLVEARNEGDNTPASGDSQPGGGRTDRQG
jgi:hypothetical protein